MGYTYRRILPFKGIVFPIPEDPTVDETPFVPVYQRWDASLFSSLFTRVRLARQIAVRSPLYYAHVQERYASPLGDLFEAVFDDRQTSISRMLMRARSARYPQRGFPISVSAPIRAGSIWTPRTQPTTTWTPRVEPNLPDA